MARTTPQGSTRASHMVRDDERILGRVAHGFHAGTSRPRARSAASRPASQSRNAGAGSIRTSSGTHSTGSGNGLKGSSRTRSFSVVTMARAPADRADSTRPAASARL